jgi:geranyl-CoA carboxylase beta subunit
MLDDGVIDPRDTRRVLGLSLSRFQRADRVALRPLDFGVARP